MKPLIIIFFMASFLFMKCKSQQQKADLIVINAKIYAVDDAFQIAESFAIKNGKFLAIGKSKDIQDKYSSDEIIDLHGKVVYPGFYDAHCHFLSYGLGLQETDLVGTKSFNEVIDQVKQHALKFKSEWILGRGWDQNDWDIKDLPDNEMLNHAFPDIPVVLTRIDGHALIANNEALKRAGINLNSRIKGGEFLVKNGKLTGVLIDNAMGVLNKAIPVPDKMTKKAALLKSQNNCFVVGLTTVCDAGLSFEEVNLIEDLQKSDSLKMRIYVMLSPSKENIEHYVKKGPFTSDKLTIRCIKLYADGALGSRGACLLEPYSDDLKNKGLIVEDINKLKEICQTAYNYNFQIATHAIGDSANRLVLNIYGNILKDANDRRWRIEHAQVVNKEDFTLFKKYTIIPSVQPTHATSDMYWAGQRLGKERIKFAYAYKTLLSQNKWLAFGSDFPVEDINPLFGFYAAVSRMDQKFYPEGGFQIENALTRQEAIKGMTIWAAKASFEENQKGSIEIGKLADFVVLDKDIMTIDIKEVPGVKVLQTFIGGEKVYQK
jgi:predicted amidohydrolase YtcJ